MIIPVDVLTIRGGKYRFQHVQSVVKNSMVLYGTVGTVQYWSVHMLQCRTVMFANVQNAQYLAVLPGAADTPEQVVGESLMAAWTAGQLRVSLWFSKCELHSHINHMRRACESMPRISWTV